MAQKLALIHDGSGGIKELSAGEQLALAESPLQAANDLSVPTTEWVKTLVAGLSGGSTPWEVVTGAKQAVNGGRYLCDTRAGVLTVTAPGTPSSGESFEVLTLGADTNVLTINWNGANHETSTDATMTININRIRIMFVFDGAVWRIL